MKNIFNYFQKFSLKKCQTLTNPYIKGAEGQKAWDDRYGSMQQSIKHWRIACFAVLLMSLGLAGAVAYIATTSKIQPFIVETHEGMPYAISPMKSISIHDQRLINFAINQFMINARTVVHDSEAQKALLDKVYAYSADQTLSFLHNYYQKNNPFEIAPHVVVAVNIVSSLPMSKDTWQITWDETERSVADNSIVKTTHWIANVMVQLGEVNPHFMLENPFGLYISQIHWTQALRGQVS